MTTRISPNFRQQILCPQQVSINTTITGMDAYKVWTHTVVGTVTFTLPAAKKGNGPHYFCEQLATNIIVVQPRPNDHIVGSGNGVPITLNKTGAFIALFCELDGTWSFVGATGGVGGIGTVTSVGLADGSGTPIYGITGSPVTTAGTLTFTLNNQTANNIFAGPTSGGAAQPTFRAMVAADIPAGILPGGFSGFGAPTALVGTAAITGVATTAIRSDGAPAINQAMVPVWTALHIFTGNAGGGQLQFGANGAYAAPTVNRGVLNYDTTGGILTLAARSSGGSTTMNLNVSNAGTDRNVVAISNVGAVTIAQPASGTALTVTGIAAGTGINLAAGAFQFNGTAGTSGQLFTSAGANALPTWTTLSGVAVTSLTGTANQITVSASVGAVTLSIPSTWIAPGSIEATTTVQIDNNTAKSFVYSDANKQVASTAAPTNGQLLIGSTGNIPVAAALTAGTAISVTNGAGTITIANTGVTSAVAGTGISVSGATGAVTISLISPVTAVLGGTGQTVYVLGDTLYANATTTLARLAGTTSATKQFLTQTGTGTVSAAPAWGTIATGDVPALGANPTATVGTSAVNGSATTYIRSDGAPAIDLTMAPTWTGNHTFSGTGNPITVNATTGGNSIKIVGASGHGCFFEFVDGNTGLQDWLWGVAVATAKNCQIYDNTNARLMFECVPNATATSTDIKAYGPVANATVSMQPDESTFTFTITGCTAANTGTGRWSRKGNNITLHIPAITGTSNSTALTYTGLPAALQITGTGPVYFTVPPGCMEDAGAIQTVAQSCFISTGSGTVTFLKANNSAGFTNTTTVKGISNQFTISYLLTG